jgi:nitrogen fixation/metabolism regulation signal transduction histidine kinase
VRTHKGKGKSFEDLDRLYNEIIGIIRKVEVDRETDRQYFRGIIDHAGAGILTFNESGDIEIINAAFKKLLGIKTLQNISALQTVSPQLPELLQKMKPGYQKLLRISVEHETIGLSLKATEFRLQGKRIRLVSVQNIQHELEEEELDAWQKLIRVLTHEIMNSVTPVNSLTNTIIKLFESDGRPKDVKELDETILRNALEGLHSIEKRNKGLIGFVQSYRSLTRIQKPAFTDLSVEELFNRIVALTGHELESQDIKLMVNIQAGFVNLNADEKLLEQVLINLVNNAAYAVKGKPDPKIQLVARTDHDERYIEVHDNGAGIPEETAGSIFVPFFTTKEEGSGIGLSLSRQIMRVHGGSISVRSKPGETVFILRFPNA